VQVALDPEKTLVSRMDAEIPTFQHILSDDTDTIWMQVGECVETVDQE
jgi:hypothetical protein